MDQVLQKEDDYTLTKDVSSDITMHFLQLT